MGEILSLILLLYYLYLIVTAVFLLLDNREPSATIAWLIVFIVFPVFGFIFYILFGQNRRSTRKAPDCVSQFVDKNLTESLRPLIEQQKEKLENLRLHWQSAYKRELMQLLFNVSDSLLTTRNTVRIFHHGKDKFEALCEDIRQANTSIHLEYFIIRHDALGQRIKDLLIERAKAGVKVRVLYDSVGSLFLGRRYINELRRAGIEIYPFMSFLSIFNVHTLNYRNHRKIVVIDGIIGYNGGMNIGLEYVEGGKYSFWRDTHLRVSGEAVAIYQSIFAIDWFNTTKQAGVFDRSNFPPVHTHEAGVPLQVSTSGPDSQWESIKQLYFAMIKSAEKQLYIQTPYFIPETSIFMALKTAALSGIKVRVMLTGKVDHWLPYWSAFTYFEELLHAGVEIYHYQKGLMHAKTISVDSQVCSVGTANLDVRSFHLNYETNTMIYDEVCAREVEARFEEDMKDCRQFTLDDLVKLGTAKKLRNSLARLFAPLL
jgi:cardiolipin synthase